VLDQYKAEAQQVLDDLLRESLIPFALRVGLMLDQGFQYRVDFYDSRMRFVEFSWAEGQSFKDVFRAAVLDRVDKITGPLKTVGSGGSPQQ
jgi:ribulose bisphosphate carboxylase small subunit